MIVVESRWGFQPNVTTITDLLVGEKTASLHLRLGNGVIRDEDEVSDVVSDGFDPINVDLRLVQRREDRRDLKFKADDCFSSEVDFLFHGDFP